MSDSSDSKKIVLADFGDLSKPLNTLIEKCADAVGALFQPHQIRRIAEAEAEAEEIRALTEIKIDRIQRRAATRFIAEETKKQMNMEAIIRSALPQVSDRADPGKMENDWVANFFDKCRLVSDEEMQSLWSTILAGEANSPGHFSKRTVNLVAELEKFEIDAFLSLCRFVFVAGDNTRVPLIFNFRDPIYSQNGIHFGMLTHLSQIGMINFDSHGGFNFNVTPHHTLHYFGKKLELQLPENSGPIAVGSTTLSISGVQLSSLSPVEPVTGLVEYAIEKWQRFGITTVVTESVTRTE